MNPAITHQRRNQTAVSSNQKLGLTGALTMGFTSLPRLFTLHR